MQPSKHADILLECAHELYSKEKLCDVVLCAEGKSLSAHRVVLVAYSSYFAANSEITDAPVVLDVMHLKFRSMQVLVNYMYTGILELKECSPRDVKLAAESLSISSALQIISDIEEDETVRKKSDLQQADKDVSNNETTVKEELGNNPEEDIEETDVTQSDAEVAKPPKRRCKNRPAVKTTFPPNPTRKASSRARREQPATRNRKRKVEMMEPNEIEEPAQEEAETLVKCTNESVPNGENEQVTDEADPKKNVDDTDEFPASDAKKAFIIRSPTESVKRYKQEDGTYKCPEDNCTFTTFNDKNFKRHWRQHTGEKPYKCSECNKGFSDLKYIYEHLPTHSETKSFSCGKCTQKFKTKKNLSRHFSSCHKGEEHPFLCVMCNSKFTSKYGLHTHERSVHGIKPSTVCDFPGCGYAAPTPSELKKHQVKHIPREERAKIMCDICGALFVSPKCLRSHLRFMHYGEPQNCPYCPYTTPAKHLLIGHCARVHKCTLAGVPVEPKFFCDMCDFKCYHKHEYKCHLLKHADDLPHKCTFCTFATHMKGTLVKHLRTHTKERPFSCKICGKTFTNHSSLAMHNRSHLGIKPHKCSQCEKAFASSSTLKEHMFSHQNISPFMCHICCYGCVRKNILRKHIITKHGPDALPPDMVFKRGYPLLKDGQPEGEEMETAESQKNPDENRTAPLLPHSNVHLPVTSDQVVVLRLEEQISRVEMDVSNSDVIQQVAASDLDTAPTHENLHPPQLLVAENVNVGAGPTAAMANPTNSSASLADQISESVYGVISHPDEPPRPQLVATCSQSTSTLQQPMTSAYSHDNQPSQTGYAAYPPSFQSNTSASLLQQLYLTSSVNNVPQ